MKTSSLGSTIRCLVFSVVIVAAPWLSAIGLGQELTKVPFPYGPLGLNSLPWVVAKEARFFEKNRLDVDMVYVGASAVIVQSMLSGSANMAGFGGPAVVTNVLRGGDIIQVAAMAPYFTQSLLVRSELRDLQSLQGKIGITRFGSVTDFALRTILERHNLKNVNVLQMGGFPEAVAGLSRGAIDGAVLSPPHTFRMVREGFRELVSPKDLRSFGSGFLTQAIVARRAFASSHRDVVLRMIKTTIEATKHATTNEEFTKKLIAKYLMVQVNMIDAKSAQSVPTSAYFDNSFVTELKQSGFLDSVWK
jgi:ABC-type nitrate/sulfonate/bicarbonate transport system substrate-binding protein